MGLLGRGGMGEVYRADDLKLEQPVALKFLPRALEGDPDRLERLYAEVRTARQVSHPAVCRVWDIGEADGQHFLSMEFVDGENLASLLRRIGRFPLDKALDVARQIAEGLAAAHAKGLLHRDLKPANVMLDGQGQVRLTDFGLAGLADTLVAARTCARARPSYMSPEQLLGREVSVRSDIYALGLVIYELVTGRRAFEGKGFAELARQSPRRATDRARRLLAPGLDPAVERTILACLEKEPRKRPPSALVVAAMLSGRDPLEAAIAAGETPSPELVAAAGETEGLAAAGGLGVPRRRRGRACSRSRRSRRRATCSPVCRSRRARRRSRTAPATCCRGSAGRGRSTPRSASAPTCDYVRWVEERDRSTARWDSLATGEPPLPRFWYRQSPRPLTATEPQRAACPGTTPRSCSPGWPAPATTSAGGCSRSTWCRRSSSSRRPLPRRLPFGPPPARPTGPRSSREARLDASALPARGAALDAAVLRRRARRLGGPLAGASRAHAAGRGRELPRPARSGSSSRTPGRDRSASRLSR